MKKILVTGGAGFLGSHLCERLLKNGNEVVCIDNLYTGHKENIKDLIDDSNFKFIEHDITEPLSIDVDEIYNFACPASPVHYQHDPVKTIKTNVYGTINVLELAKKNMSKIFQASTSEVYGDPDVHPQKENYWGNVNPIGLRSCYDEGKRCAETLFFDYHRQYNLKIKIVRIFNTYGPRMYINDGRVVSNFIIQALNNDPITVNGDGKQTRSFCYVDDLIDGAIKMMNYDDSFRGPVNIGSTDEISIIELAKQIIDLTNSKSSILHKSLPSDDPQQRQPDIKIAKEKLNWEKKVALEKGLEKTIIYFKKIINSDSTKVN
tara:strand:+ start:5950 stop:6906 length:957 start_codon:yes stop_codon:yes gene_type:complete